MKALRVTEEHTLKRVRNLRLWLKELQSEDQNADRDDDHDSHNLGLSDLHAIELEFRTIAERLYKTEAALESLRKELSSNSRAHIAEVKLARYKRAYVRCLCRDLYSSGARWKTTANPMRADGVFVEEDCEPSKRRTFFPFPHQFEKDVANEIVELLNRATDEQAREER